MRQRLNIQNTTVVINETNRIRAIKADSDDIQASESVFMETADIYLIT